MIVIARLVAENAGRWHAMHLAADRIPAFDATARRLTAPDAKARYLAIAAKTGVPWFVVAVIHEREAGGPPHWDKQLGQGDPLAHVSIHDPAGRGPFFDHPADPPGQGAFYRCALDALIDCAPHAARWTDWSAGGTLTLLEEYNGLGYAARGVPSAYVWSGTDQYVSGKYVADHVYRRGVVDVQEGCAGIIARMMAIDPDITFAQEAPPQVTA
jgi:lysozyme family protein